MNWDDARVFLAVCRESTLRGAARVLGVDQATVGRRITALEKSLNATLFLRTSDGYALTAVGEAAMRAVEKMEHSALELQRRIQGLDDRLTGIVRVTTTDSLAIDFLIPAVAILSWAVSPALPLSFRPVEMASLAIALGLVATLLWQGRSSRGRGVVLIGAYIGIAVWFFLAGDRGG